MPVYKFFYKNNDTPTIEIIELTTYFIISVHPKQLITAHPSQKYSEAHSKYC